SDSVTTRFPYTTLLRSFEQISSALRVKWIRVGTLRTRKHLIFRTSGTISASFSVLENPKSCNVALAQCYDKFRFLLELSPGLHISQEHTSELDSRFDRV